MRLLFVLQYPGHLRYYDTVLLELARRGHEVLLAFDQPHKQPEGLRALEGADAEIRVVGRLPERTGLWGPFAVGLRGTLDYLKYLHPDFAALTYLRRRWEKFLPPPLSGLRRVKQITPATFERASRALRRFEDAIPSSDRFEDWLGQFAPDAVVCSPYITTYFQSDLVKSARALGIPTVYGVASWDNLTTKGQVRVVPDAIAVWNEDMRDEAEHYHLVDPRIVHVTGAQPYDRWFERRPSTTYDAFLEKVGLPTGRPYVLFVGSTASISAPEAERGFVRRWVQALRAEPSLADVSVLVRPHPYNSAHWRPEDVADLGAAVIWPPWGANPVDEDDRADYYDSMAHSAAVVGINTSAMIESAIVGKPVFTVRDSLFEDTQDGTLHFRYLLREHGGFVETAKSIEEHISQLAAALSDAEAAEARSRAFVARFVRPEGVDKPRTPVVADLVEHVARSTVRAPAASPATALLRAVLRPLAAATWFAARSTNVLEGSVLPRLPRPLKAPIRKWLRKRREQRLPPTPPPPSRAPAREEAAA